MWAAAIPTCRMVKEIKVSAVDRGAYQGLAGGSSQGSFDSSILGRHRESELGRIVLLTLNLSVSENRMEDTGNADLLCIEWPTDL